jgi:hypothetical protein
MTSRRQATNHWKDAMHRLVMSPTQAYRNDCAFEPIGLPNPTSAKPGTPEKVDVLRKRLEAGEQLHHPQDAWGNSPPDPFEDTNLFEDTDCCAFLAHSLD